jgi:hypothetical protein
MPIAASLHGARGRLLRVEGDEGAEGEAALRNRYEGGAPFGIAGIWENWKEPASGEWIRTFAIITTDSNELVADIHDRMPAPSDYARWLGEEPDPRNLMRPFPAELMRMWPISTRVNKPENDDPSIVEPIQLPRSAPIPWNFGSSCIGRIIRTRNAGGRLNSRRQLLHRCVGDTLNKLPKSQPSKTVFANREYNLDHLVAGN